MTGLTDLARSAIAGRRFLPGGLTSSHLTEAPAEVAAPPASSPAIGGMHHGDVFNTIFQAAAARVLNANTATGLIGSTGSAVATELADARASFTSTFALYQLDVRPDVITEMRRRLAELLGDESWEPGDVLPSRESLVHMLQFFRAHPDLRPPALTISSTGNFVASWLRTPQELVRLEFEPAPLITWLVLTAPNRDGRSQKGTATIRASAIKQALAPFDVWRSMVS